jgi:hypothetical protein
MLWGNESLVLRLRLVSIMMMMMLMVTTTAITIILFIHVLENSQESHLTAKHKSNTRKKYCNI